MPPALAVVAIVDLREGFEDAIDALLRDAGAIVRNDKLKIARRVAFGRHVDVSAVLGELHRVRDEIDDDLLQRARSSA